MGRWTAALLFAGCLAFEVWAQSPPVQQPSNKLSSDEKAASGQTAPAQETSQSPFDRFKEFSAIMTGGPVPGTDDEIHIYRSGNLLRMEANEGNSYQITDLEKQETHGLAKGGCLRYKYPYVRSFPFSASKPENKYERVPAGKETVDGHVCQIEDITISSPKLLTPVKLRLWEAEDLQGFPIKIETRMHRLIEYKNVVLGPQDPTLFIVPNTCQTMDRNVPHDGSPAAKPKKAPPGKAQ